MNHLNAALRKTVNGTNNVNIESVSESMTRRMNNVLSSVAFCFGGFMFCICSVTVVIVLALLDIKTSSLLLSQEEG